MKKTSLKRMLSLLLSMVMILSSVSLDAFASETIVPEEDGIFAAVAEELASEESTVGSLDAAEPVETADEELVEATPSEATPKGFYKENDMVTMKTGALWLGEGESAIDRSLITKVSFVQGDGPEDEIPVLYADEGEQVPVYLSEEGTVLTVYYLDSLSFNPDYSGMFNGFTALKWLEFTDDVTVPYSPDIPAAGMFDGVTGLETLILGKNYDGAVPVSKDGYWVTESNEAFSPDELYDALPLTEKETFCSLENGHEFSVTYELNGGENSSKNKSVYRYGTGLNLANPKKTYNTFSGWYMNAALEGDPVTGISADHMGNVTLYAAWTPYTYSVVFNANGGTGTMATQKMTVGKETALRSNSFTLKGYHFYRWNTKADGSGTDYKNKQKVALTTSKDKKITLYAVWKENKYTIKFNANGGTGTMSAMENRKYSTAYTLPANKFTRKGYLFGGWSTSKTGSKKYSDKAKVSKLSSADGGEVTLYAVWNPISYTIKYNKNGGTGDTMSTTKAKYGTAVTLRANTYKKTGYTFKGWSKSSASTTVAYENKESVKNLKYEDGATVTLYAVWSKKKYTITYDYNGGKAPESKNRTTYTITDEFTLKSPTKTGYTFAGWYSDSKLTKKVTKVKRGTTGNKTFYAKWTQNHYTVKFSANGGSGSMTSKKLSYTTSYTVPANKFTRTGYTFKYYTDSKGNKYYPGDKVSKLSSKDGATVTLTAYWKANTYTIKFNANGGSGTMSSKTATYGKTLTLPANKFTNVNGVKFAGWNTKANGKGTTYKNKADVKNLKTSGTITLYAQWKVSATIKIVRTKKINYERNGMYLSGSGTYSGFEVWRSEKKQSGFTKLGTLQGSVSSATEYYDSSPEAGKSYYYKARAIVVSGEETYYGSFSSVAACTTALYPDLYADITMRANAEKYVDLLLVNDAGTLLTVGGATERAFTLFYENEADVLEGKSHYGLMNDADYKQTIAAHGYGTVRYSFDHKVKTNDKPYMTFFCTYDGCDYTAVVNYINSRPSYFQEGNGGTVENENRVKVMFSQDDVDAEENKKAINSSSDK